MINFLDEYLEITDKPRERRVSGIIKRQKYISEENENENNNLENPNPQHENNNSINDEDYKASNIPSHRNLNANHLKRGKLTDSHDQEFEIKEKEG